MKKLALFDLDSTLNTVKNRSGYVPENTGNNAAWLGWHKAFRMEKLNLDLIKTAKAYKQAGYEIAVVSNRDSSLAVDTKIYLSNSGFPEGKYFLRNIDDNRHTSDWKTSTIFHLLAFSEPVEVHIFDDDKRMLNRVTEKYEHHDSVFVVPHLIEFK